MNADQAPVSTDKRYWTQFLGQDTAFYVGAEQIARATRLPVLYVRVRRIRRGYYEAELQPLWDGRETAAQFSHRALCARLRNRRARAARGLAVVVSALAAQKAPVWRRLSRVDRGLSPFRGGIEPWSGGR
jgi:hypothetical protein